MSDALWLAYEFQSFRERVRSELEALVKWADENKGRDPIVGNAWAAQVEMWAMTRLARLDQYEDDADIGNTRAA